MTITEKMVIVIYYITVINNLKEVDDIEVECCNEPKLSLVNAAINNVMLHCVLDLYTLNGEYYSG